MFWMIIFFYLGDRELGVEGELRVRVGVKVEGAARTENVGRVGGFGALTESFGRKFFVMFIFL